MDSGLHVFFLSAADSGRRLCVYHSPQGKVVRGNVIYLHPLAEEMNKSRRMAALQARALANEGFAVLQIDLQGCGDSSGDFGDARWDQWLADVSAARAWLQARHEAPLWLWGLRAGCLIAVEAARQLPDATRFLFWQPATSGKALLQQFLRLKLAGGLLDGTGKAKMSDLKNELSMGHAVAVAGYSVSAQLAHCLEQATLSLPPVACTVLSLEVSPRSEGEITSSLASTVERWKSEGHQTFQRQVKGPAFWQTSEIEDAPELIAHTLSLMHSCERA